VGSGVVEEDASHCLGGEREELGTILECARLLIDHFQESLVHQRGRPQSVIAALGAQVARRQATKLVIDDGNQLLRRLRISAAPGAEQSSYLLTDGATHVTTP
jgi:hypothetical protein